MDSDIDRSQKDLPTTMSLRAFETVARLGSISRAANALCLTQSAVSKQVHALEATLSIDLFTRSNRGLTLTDKGRMYLPYVRSAIAALTEGLQEIGRASKQAPLQLHVVPVVGERWLLPRFTAFRKSNPDIFVEFPFFITNNNDGDPDATIKYGNGEWPNRTADYLFGKELLLVVAPALMPAFASPQGCGTAELTFLEHHQAGIGWPEARDALGFPAHSDIRTMTFGFYGLIIRAAVAGEGAALLPQLLILDELRDGSLMRVRDIELQGPHGYWLTRSKNRPMGPHFRVLRAWLIEQARVMDTVGMPNQI